MLHNHLIVLIIFFTGALYGSTEIVSMKALTRDNYVKENRLPDWANMKDNVHTL